MPEDVDHRALVRRGYDVLSERYRGDGDTPARHLAWAAELRARLPARARVLDAGCGNGIPVAADLSAHGHAVTGVDVSGVQVARARRLVPGARFVRADLTRTGFAAGSFDAVVCLYVLIHLPRQEQPEVLRRMCRWLRPGGWLLAVTGETDWTGTEQNWLGGPAPMWWSHPDAGTSRRWLAAAGFQVVAEEFVPEGAGGHRLFWARRPA
ncbi:class I SAM-dependent methyltransferase [Marinitenerispora sediminis]|uniref:Class I SAM-dependent methyltransferase n=1 Tax=Marinitenerispora sediminis TaxID=1931232 RepID=A0A368TAK8_9ACTN|nr:class I SAM-dependent methyltransferase [Marinitenerispora sediminis]RCV53380.1 class I SAM-dependent methyltransferase [Marinitenerispora sediminis]RCV58424.1 class I SAM-dependent methyltransferase [Marinitenerispora sediminis]RCV61795.1 class I SAM-dependent methyltransferase [Marinitenerispora sediminis]